ncbi:MAG: hypothetical protein U0237_09085 [Thermoleophilia bacterium]
MTSLPIAGPGPFSVYTGRVTNWPAVAAACLLLVPFLALGAASRGPWTGLALPSALALAVAAATVVTGTSVRAAAGPAGLTVRWGLLGWPRLTYPAREIARAEVIDLPLMWVAWGLWWTPRRTCCTVRSGPTLRLILFSGRTVTVSVPDPHAAVAALSRAS